MIENLKNHILHLLQKDGTPRSRDLLARELGIRADLHGALDAALEDLDSQGRIILGNHDRVRLPSLEREVTGIFHAHARGFGFVDPQADTGAGELFIPAKATGSAMSGDRVLVQVSHRRSPRDPERISGKVVKVLERAHRSVVGTLAEDSRGWSVLPDGGELHRPILLEQVDGREVCTGDKVAVQIRAYPTRTEPARGTITDILGRAGRYDAEVAAIIRRYGLPEAFDDSSLVQANNARADFRPDPGDSREDLTDMLIVTIDPDDAQDYDDAVSLASDAEGNTVLGVHIADVSHFIPPGSPLDRAAQARGNSVYLPGRTLPMLPEMLSNDLCSLKPNQLRYTKSVFLTYGKDGTLRHSRFVHTLIKSRARLTYGQVDEILQGRDASAPPEIERLLRRFESLARQIEARRQKAGMLQLQMPETEVLLGHDGRVRGLQPVDTSYPHTIIEMFMVEANVAVAGWLDRYCIPFMRRVHPDPPANTLRQLARTLRLLGVKLPRQIQRQDFQRVLQQVGNTRLALPVNLQILRSLSKATYAPANIGHYALAAPKYCHFTSPIRRYADLLVHRVLDDALHGDMERARRRYTYAQLTELGAHITDTEQDAEEATEEVKTIFILHLLQARIGTELPGVVVGLSRFGAQVRLPEFGVNGTLRTENLGADTWQFDEANQCLIGKHTRSLLRLAQNLRVRIGEVTPAAGHLDLLPAQGLKSRSRYGKRQGPKRGGSARTPRGAQRPQSPARKRHSNRVKRK
jgi:ribonuclease R